MKPSDLPGKSFNCKCGRRHTVPTEHFIYSSDAIERLPAITGQYVSNPDYLIIADKRTFEITGSRIESALKNRGAVTRNFIVRDREGKSPQCDDITRDTILKEAHNAEAYIAAGSGVINDLTKWIAFERKKPFFTVPTAASMNGYASANIAATIDNLKVLIYGQACRGVFAVPEIIENAPLELTASGFGDVIAKPVSSSDWKLNQFLFDEYYCQFTVDILKDLENVYLSQPEKIPERDPGAIQTLFEALLYSSIAMTIAGTSSPASGGEHIISHTIDMISSIEGNSHDFHGRQVGLGSILSAALYEKILSIETPEFSRIIPDINKDFWGPLTKSVRNEYRKKIEKYKMSINKLSKPENWDNLRSDLQQTLMPPKTIKDCLKQAGGAHRIPDIRINDKSIKEKKFLEIFKNAYQMRERFTILDLAVILGIMPEQAEEIVHQWAV